MLGRVGGRGTDEMGSFCNWLLGGSREAESLLLFKVLLQVGDVGENTEVLGDEKVDIEGPGIGGGGGGMEGELCLRSSWEELGLEHSLILPGGPEGDDGDKGNGGGDGMCNGEKWPLGVLF